MATPVPLDLPDAAPLLVGREPEQARLHALLSAARAGRGSLALIGGEAGIGKTTLAEALCRDAARDGAMVLIGRCYDLTETPPYGPWIDLFARHQPTGDAPPLPDAFARRGTVGAVASQAALFEQVLDFLAALAAQRPVVLLLDDLHWADPASLDLLRFLARSIPTLPILLLVAYRVEEVTRRHPLYALLPALVREARPGRLDLRPLDADALRALIGGRYRLAPADTSRLIAYLQERTESNPFFLGELLRTLEEGGTLHPTNGGWALADLRQVRIPPLLRQVIDGRLARLGDEMQGLLAIAAVIGHEVPLDLWITVAECDEDALLALAERGLDALLLIESGGDRVRFSHALIREALYEGIPAIRRRRIHRRAGEALAAMRAPDPDAVAHHFQRAEDDRALPWLLKAGYRAQAAYAWMTAVARFEAALALMAAADVPISERGWLAVRASRLIQFVDAARARVLADEAVALARIASDRALAAFARLQCGMLDCFIGDVAHGIPEVQAGADGLAALSEAERAHFIAHTPGIGPASQLPDGRGTVVMWRAYVGPFAAVQALGERLVPEEAAAGDEVVKQSLKEGIWGLAMAYAMLGMPDEAAAMFPIAHAASLRAGHHAVASLTMWLELELVALPYRAEEIAGRRRLAERSEEEWARANGAVSATIPRRFVRLSLLLLEGEWEEAERIASVVSGEAQGLIHYRMMALGHLAALALPRGDTERAWWAVNSVLPAGAATEPGTVWPFNVVATVQRVAAALASETGDLPAAREWLSAHDRWLAWNGAVLGRSEGQLLWAAYYRAAGDPKRAFDRARQALAHATEPRQSLALLAAHRLLGELATDAGRYGDAATHLDVSLALADACAAPYERALTLLALATLRIATGKRAEAQAFLDEVRTICTSLGAQPALARADALAAKATQAKPVSAYPAGLSAREAEVLRLVADGLTNAQVADRLFLSPHTINAHLTAIYAKLAVPSRAAAIRFALDHGLR